VPDDLDYAELFSALCAEYAGVTGVKVPQDSASRGFGSQALKVNNKIFAMLVNDRLVVKLPRARVTELIETGRGQPFESGKGTPMKEWVALTGDEAECRALVVEAQTFVG
jgi:hypothetical protein